MAALLTAMSALAACRTDENGLSSRLPYVAEFLPGTDTPEERQFVLTPAPTPQLLLLPEASSAPPVTPSPDLGEDWPTTPTQTLPITPTPDTGGSPSFGSSVAWVNDGQYLAVVTYGSSSCPSGPHSIDVVADQEIEIRLGLLFPDRDVCTADVRSHVTVMELPQGIMPTKPLVTHFGTRKVTMPAVVR